MLDEDVRGVVVGAPETAKLYKFYTYVAGVEHLLERGWFETDGEAERYIAERYPKAYARGIEMRVFDRGH